MLTYCDTEAEFSEQLIKAKDRIVVVDFFATWCGPCQAIAPQFESLAAKYKECVFIKVDVDKNKSVSSQYQITGLPTFALFQRKSILDKVVGADISRVEQLIQNFLRTNKPSRDAAFTSKGQTLGGDKTHNPWKNVTCDPVTKVCSIKKEPTITKDDSINTTDVANNTIESCSNIPPSVQDAFERRKQKYLEKNSKQKGMISNIEQSNCGIM